MTTLFSPQESQPNNTDHLEGTQPAIEQAEVIHPSPADQECFAEALISPRPAIHALRRAQALFQKYCPTKPGESIVDEFITERRKAAETE